MLRVTTTTVLLLAAMFAFDASAQTVWYVDQDAPGANTGFSWQDAFNDLQDALDVASNGHRINVAAGTYYPSLRTSAATLRSETFLLDQAIQLYGGYAGHDNPDPNQRDFALYESILSGDLQQNDGPDFTNYNDNAYHVITVDGSGGTPTIDGFTITAGCASGSNHYEAGGLITESGAVDIANCLFLANYAAETGAALVYTGSIVDSTFHDNFAYYSSGALSVIYGTSMSVSRCTFSDNESTYGAGAIFTDRASLSVSLCSFANNEATMGNGGAVEILGWEPWLGCQIAFANCLFSNNSAHSSGGAVYFDSATASEFTECLFIHNEARGGGAVDICGSPCFINSRFIGNTATEYGGAINSHDGYNYYGLPCLVNCELIGNHAQLSGGAIIPGTRTKLFNCTLAHNYADDRGGAIYCLEEEYSGIFNKADLANCIVWGNYDSFGASLVSQVYSLNLHEHIEADYSCIRGWSSAAPGTGNINRNPLFIDPDGDDDIIGTADDNVRLNRHSPCIDAGDNRIFDYLEAYALEVPITTDLDGNDRFLDAPLITDRGAGAKPIVDMGPYEHQPDCNGNGIRDDYDIASGTSEDINANEIPDECELCVAPLGSGDIDGNFIIDLVDYDSLDSCLLGPGESVSTNCTAFDMDGDCDVDLADFSGFQAAFGD